MGDLSRFALVVEHIRQAYDPAAMRIRTKLLGDTPWLVGRLALQQLKVPPYIAWFRSTGTIDDNVKRGEHRDETPGQAFSLTPLMDIRQLVTCAICGSSEAQTEDMWFTVLNAVKDVTGKFANGYGTFDWVTQNEGNAGYVLAGVEMVVQEFTWPFIVPKSIDSLTILQSVEHDCEGIQP